MLNIVFPILFSCNGGNSVSLECPSEFETVDLSSPECRSGDVKCCKDLYGMSEEYIDFISSGAAKCLAESWGLPPGEPTYYARPNTLQATWAVHRIFPYQCEDTLADAPGCVVFIDAETGEFLYEGETFRTVSCE